MSKLSPTHLSPTSVTNIDVTQAFSGPKFTFGVRSGIYWDSGLSVADDVNSVRWVLGDSFFVNFRNISGAN